MSWPRHEFATLMFLVCAALCTPRPARSFESDQLTRRAQPLVDAMDTANARADELLAEAADRTNLRLGCGAPLDETHRILARQVFHVMGRRTFVRPRGELPTMEFGAYSAWLESGPLSRRTFTSRDDLYSRVRLAERPILALWGPASTVRLGELLVGTDKIDHFWVQGWLYWLRSRQGEDEARAVAWGTRTELQLWGQATTGVFSWADLAANHRGYEFYSSLLGPDSPLGFDADRCVALVRGFHWENWADDHFDEVLNPSTYLPALLDDLDAYLARNRDNLCSEWPVWQDAAAQRALLEEPIDYVSAAAPARQDPFGLEELCADYLPPTGGSAPLWSDGKAPPWRTPRRDPSSDR